MSRVGVKARSGPGEAASRSARVDERGDRKDRAGRQGEGGEGLGGHVAIGGVEAGSRSCSRRLNAASLPTIVSNVPASTARATAASWGISATTGQPSASGSIG